MSCIYLLIGHSCSGKTKIVKELENHTQFSSYQAIDLDEEIEKVYGDISLLFSNKGEEFFREKELSVFKQIVKMKGKLVIALGAGFPIDYLEDKSFELIYLKNNLEDSLNKTIENGRPLASVYTADKLRELFKFREEKFECAQHQFYPAKFSPTELIKYLEKLLL